MKINKIMLGLPNTRWHNNKYWHFFPYTFGLLNSVLKKRYEVRILDANKDNLSVEQFKEKIKEYNPDILGVSCLSLQYADDLEKMVYGAKEACPNTKIVLGGIYITLLPKEAMSIKAIDYGIMGEGEFRFPMLLKELEKENPDLTKIEGLVYRNNKSLVVQEVKSYIQDLDKLPLPEYDNMDFYEYANTSNKYTPFILPRRYPYALTISSRGCPFNCIFCTSKLINGPRIRYRSAESILKEIDYLVNKYGIKELIFLDDNIYLDKKRAKKFFEGLIERNYDLEWKSANAAVYALDFEMLELMKKSKCYQIFLAFESGSIKGLMRLKKPMPHKIYNNAEPITEKARSLGFDVGGFFIIGTPGETWEEIRQTIKFAEELNLDHTSFSIATPLPKTELYEMAKRDNLLPEDFSFNNYNFRGNAIGVITTDEFTPEELEVLRAYEWDRINFKTPEKTEKFARMCGLTIKELEEWRKSTRRNLGVFVKYNNS